MDTTSISNLYTSALQRWLNQQKQSGQLYQQAEAPLAEQVNMFQPGGSYGAGQNALIEDQARQAKAEALANQVATGMSSGSLGTSTGLRIGSDMTKAKLGVQDTRTQFLADALSKLSGLRGTYAGQVGTNVDPYTNAYMGALSANNANQQNYALQLKQLEAQRQRDVAQRYQAELARSDRFMADFSGSGLYPTNQPNWGSLTF